MRTTRTSSPTEGHGSTSLRRVSMSMLATLVVAGAALFGLSGPSNADVTVTRGEAFGVRASVGLFGGPPMTRGPVPIVTLAPDASNSPQTANVAETIVQFGPAIVFSSGSATVSTQGTLGPAG